MLRRLDVAGLRAAQLLAWIGLTMLIVFAAATLLDGLSRSLADRPIQAVADIGPFLVAAGVSACFPLAHLQRANITIDLAGLALGSRSAQTLRACASLLVALVMTAMARQMFLYAVDDAIGGDTTVMLGIPTAGFWFFVAAMFGCAVATQLVVFAAEVARCTHPPGLIRPAKHG